MDRKKIVQKFHNEDLAHKKNMGVKSTAKYRRKQRALKALETKKPVLKSLLVKSAITKTAFSKNSSSSW